MLRGPCSTDPNRSRFAAGLGLSLLLHALLLMLPQRFDNRGSAARSPAQMLTLRLAAARDPSRSATPLTPLAMMPRQDRKSPRPTALRRPPSDDASKTPIETAALPAPGPAIDLDALRAQARDLARPAQPRTQVGDVSPATQRAETDLFERPSLEAVARRIGQPPRGASERLLADGSRMMRFAGNVCLRVPRELPWSRESGFGPTVLLPTNCPD